MVVWTLGLEETKYRVIGFEYPNAEAAEKVFKRATAELTDCSIWRTATPDLSRWFIIGLLTKNTKDQDFDWEGTLYPPSEEQCEWMLRRRLGRGINAVLSAEGTVKETRHYEMASAPRIPGRP